MLENSGAVWFANTSANQAASKLRTSWWLRHCCCHLAAGYSTATTRLSTALAVVVVMLLTLSGTAIAGFRTHIAQLSMKVRIASHQPGTDVTEIGTITA